MNDMIKLENKDILEISPSYLSGSLFERQVVVFKKQPLKVVPFVALCESVGKGLGNIGDFVWNQDGTIFQGSREGLSALSWQGEDEDFPVQRVTGEIKKENKFHHGFSGIFPAGELGWHSSYNYPGLPDVVGLQAVKGVEGTTTSWLNLKKAYEKLPLGLKARVENAVASYAYNPRAWAKGTPEVQLKVMENYGIGPYKMNLLQQNKLGIKGLYFSFNNQCFIKEDPELVGELKEFCLKDEFIYHHRWDVGDIVFSDQVFTLHRRENLTDDQLKKRLLHRVTFYLNETPLRGGASFYKNEVIDS